MKVKLLLILCLFLTINQSFGQNTAPVNYTDLNSGNVTLTNESLNDTVKWYKWIATDEIAQVSIKLQQNGLVSLFSSAELYSYKNGNLTLAFRDSISEDSILTLYAGVLTESTDLYLKLKSNFIDCGLCARVFPFVTITLNNVSNNCPSVTPCDLVKNGGFEQTIGDGCGNEVTDGTACWYGYENSTDLFRRYCYGPEFGRVNLGINTWDSNPVFNSRNGPPNNAIIAQLSNTTPLNNYAFYSESVQTILKSNIIQGHVYKLDYWVFNLSGSMSSYRPVNQAQVPCWIAFALTNGIVSPTQNNSTYPAGHTLIHSNMVTPINTWTQYTHTVTLPKNRTV